MQSNFLSLSLCLRVQVEFYVNENTFKERLKLFFIKNQRSSEWRRFLCHVTASSSDKDEPDVTVPKKGIDRNHIHFNSPINKHIREDRRYETLRFHHAPFH